MPLASTFSSTTASVVHFVAVFPVPRTITCRFFRITLVVRSHGQRRGCLSSHNLTKTWPRQSERRAATSDQHVGEGAHDKGQDKGTNAHAHLLEQHRNGLLDDQVAEPLEPLLAVRERPGLAATPRHGSAAATAAVVEGAGQRDRRPHHQHHVAVVGTLERPTRCPAAGQPLLGAVVAMPNPDLGHPGDAHSLRERRQQRFAPRRDGTRDGHRDRIGSAAFELEKWAVEPCSIMRGRRWVGFRAGSATATDCALPMWEQKDQGASPRRPVSKTIDRHAGGCRRRSVSGLSVAADQGTIPLHYGEIHRVRLAEKM